MDRRPEISNLELSNFQKKAENLDDFESIENL